MKNLPDAYFPNLNIKIYKLKQIFLTIYGVDIYFYAIFILIAIILGLYITEKEAEKTNQDKNLYNDFFLWALPFSIIGARLYYVIFSWDLYKDNLKSIIFGIREGGLAIYGGVISSIVVLFIYSKIKKVNYAIIADTCAPSLVLGQAIGRWGNFTNREAFGYYTNSLFALRYKLDQVNNIPPSVLENKIKVEDTYYIQVHPTFLYESFFNILIFVFLVIYRKNKKFDGELALLYLLLYSLVRFFIERLRVDQLLFWNTNIAVSQVLSFVLLLTSFIIIYYKRYKIKS